MTAVSPRATRARVRAKAQQVALAITALLEDDGLEMEPATRHEFTMVLTTAWTVVEDMERT